MKKVIVIGCPGSGKSTFSKKLNEITNIPLYHLDLMYWNNDKTIVEKEVFLNKIVETLKKDSWIIDGNYRSTMELRMKEADTIFFLDMPTKLCLESERLRRGKPREDLPSYLIEEGEDEEFVNLITNFQDNQRHLIVEILDKHKDKNIVTFKSREEVENYLLKLASENVS